MLLSELHKNVIVGESAVESREAADIWEENKDQAAEYVSAAEYVARLVNGSYEVFVVDGDQRKLLGKFSEYDFKKTFKPVRPDQTPDIEGFINYVDFIEVEALKYSGDPVSVMIDKEPVILKKGDYLIRTVRKSKFVFSIEDDTDFENQMRKA
jgi:hypothetical protein